MTTILPDNRKDNVWLRRISRSSAWVLLAAVVVLVLSGWGITQTGVIYNLTFGLIDRGTANAIHRNANAPLVFFFLVHVIINIQMLVSPGRFRLAWLINSVLILAGAGIMAAAVYLEYFRRGG